MHTAFDNSPLLTGIKGKPESIIVHGAKLYIGTSTGSLNVYRTDSSSISQPPPSSDPCSSSSPSKRSLYASPTKPASILSTRSSTTTHDRIPPSSPTQSVSLFAKRSVDQLGIIKEANLLVSLSDGYVSLHDLSTLELRTQLVQTKGATTFGVDTSIQKRSAHKIPDYGPGPLRGGRASIRGGGSKFNPTSSTLNSRSAFRPGAVGDQNNNGQTLGTGTLARNRTSVFDIPSKDWQTASMRGMDAMVKYREEERRKAMEGARFGGAAADADGKDGVMTLVTVLAVAVKRKLLVFRWVDGEFWDTREVGLNHTPRSLAFVTPTRLFMGYNVGEYGTISIPLAAESTVAYTHPNSGYGGNGSNGQLRREANVHPPNNSTSGPLIDLTSASLSSWHVEDFDLSSNGANTAEEGGEHAAGAAHPSTSISVTGGTGAGFGAALGGLGGLGGYMGLSSRGKMSVLHVDGGEVLFVRDGSGIFLGADGSPTRRECVEWSASPLEVAFAKPYVFAILPSGSIPSLKNSSLPNANHPVLQIRSVGTLFAVQTLCFPPVSASTSSKSSSPSSPPQVRLLTPSTGNKPPVYVVVTPTDRATLEKEGSTIWQLEMQGWGRQIDELVEKGEFEEALGLLDSVDNVILEDKDERRAHVQGLFAVSLFADQRFDEAIEMFMELDTNPAKVIALYPSNVAGELSRGREEWFPIFGGKTPVKWRATLSDAGETSPTPSVATLPSLATSATSAARSRLGAFLPARRPQSIVGEPSITSHLSSSPSSYSGAPKPKPTRIATGPTTAAVQDADHSAETGSIRSVRTTTREAPEMKVTGSGASRDSRAPAADPSSRKALDALGKFLADRRRIFKPLLESSPHLESKDHMAMSQIKRDTHWLLSLPNKPFSEMEKEELIAVAQTVDTALFKTFLQTKPALIGPLCRIENWCEVEQVEELLKERKKYSELIALYGGKEMHSKALGLLKQFADDEDDTEEKMRPTIRYLQNLGPEFMDVILETSHWLLDVDGELGMEVFTADTGKVGSWPRLEIVHDLNRFDKELCAAYLEFIVENTGEADPELHDKLIKLYLRRAASLRERSQCGSRDGNHKDTDQKESEARSTSARSPQEERIELIQKLLKFLRTSTQYRPEQMLVRLPADDDDRDMLEARALLLGRMGQHEGALSIYVRKLQDAYRAEEYCREVWRFREAFAWSSTTATHAQQQQQQRQSTSGGGLEGGGAGGGRSNRQQSFMVDQAAKERADDEVFLTLLRIYLDTSSNKVIQLDDALGLIQRHAAKIDLRSALDLLPPSVPVSNIAGFVSVNLGDLTRKQHEAKNTMWGKNRVQQNP
ncbi:related to Vam6/Vps39-like protein involved in vacuolar morphogenesis [Melanopsichium pennsylvanicum]|uniref:Related to Vam6/Vps39-like protein involved in vacuolar morphogenesis n=2 Tax=Melanopsichium pennsylvanicum TaxID=63383 RepID=A0AAJ4XK33_9BASI|nr:related to Vam6/Vps39-like protein involved in vacuolar morphogenesis [Melanopsichium pennsylvanicum 4]SNX83782.1 related to Vam6/Vps39-like protein involved in vacuolar morphogenesis [Melanopsichium pennsylvanicum]